LPFFGRIYPDRVSRAQRELRQAERRKLETLVTKLIDLPEEPRQRPLAKSAVEKRSIAPEKEYLLFKGKLIELDHKLKAVIEERGGVPGGVLVKGSEMGGGSPVSLTDLVEEEEAAGTDGGIKYDEWDYKRGGYKKNWCSLYEQDIHPGHEPVVEQTLRKYGGYVNVLRKKFELLKREPRTQRRQRDGDDIDLDAVIEAFSDLRAGLSPGENLFTRLDRAERNIAVLFLIDMSGSTKGWVNEAEKESLVLMAEALEALGDRYAVYGFSGMTRNRCDLYRVKGFDEPYAESVKRRIAGIEPKDYTRMGPFIRHAAKLLASVEARTKLLITLSDGKPEDWDAYKGEYGIEDTRKALGEARERGIHPFCITIDKEAQSYLPHMYGEVNYIFIDDVYKLPNRITEIYRRLTT
jgi:nitric oxide reductase NorD protein